MDARWTLMVCLLLGCSGDDGPPAGGDSTGGGSTTTGTTTDETADATGDSTDGTFTDPFCDDPPERPQECSGGPGMPFDVELLLPDDWLEPIDRPCVVFATAEQDDERWIGLSCELEPFPVDQVVVVHMELPATWSTPLRPGRQLRLSTDRVPGFVGASWSFVLRDAQTDELALLGAQGDALEPPSSMTAPYAVSPDPGTCAFLGSGGDECYGGEAPVDWVVEHEGRAHRIPDGGQAEIGGMILLAEARELFVPCPHLCADATRLVGTLVGSPHFDEPAVQGCDLFAQDCPAGERCVPASSTPGVWDATACVPEGGLGEGDPCELADPGLPADACGSGLVCMPSDDDPGQGTCRPLCTGSIDAPSCALGQTCALEPTGVVPPVVCVPSCDPVAQDCPDAEACVLLGDPLGSTCIEPGAGAVGDPCEHYGECEAGTSCAATELVDGCEGALGCCAPYCSVLGAPCPDGTECVPLDESLVGYEDVGLCVTPP